MACQLVALDKCPGVRPIGIGETLRRIAGKTVCMLARCDLEDIYGTSQLCGGVRSGIDGAIHTVCDLFDEHQEEGWGVLLIDASNAFNNINRQAVLWNFHVLWPSCSLFLFNTYRGWAPLIVVDANELLYSRDGVTQGDPLSMYIYTVATLPLISHIGRPNVGTDIWYADDASTCAPLHELVDRFTMLLRLGPLYGYYPEPKKCVLIVYHDHFTTASELFKPFGVNITNKS